MRTHDVVVAALCVLVLSGCSGDPTEPGVTAPNEPTVTTPNEPTVTAPNEPTLTAPNEPTVTASAEPSPSACEEAVAQAGDVSSMRDTNGQLWPAFAVCGSIDEFTAATQAHPDALDGVDPGTYVQNVCAYTPELADTALCAAGAD